MTDQAKTSGPNTGHGHVRPRADGGKTRCGGPGLCSVCNAERHALEATAKPAEVRVPRVAVAAGVGAAGPVHVSCSLTYRPATQDPLVREADHLATTEALCQQITALEALSVKRIMIAVVPGEDGMGEEVYAESVADVENTLSELGAQAEDAALLRQEVAARDARAAELGAMLDWVLKHRAQIVEPYDGAPVYAHYWDSQERHGPDAPTPRDAIAAAMQQQSTRS